MGIVGDQQIQLGVLLHLDAQLIQTLDGGVAGKEVLGTGAKGDDLQILQADDAPGDGLKVPNHPGTVGGGADGVLGDVRFQVAHTQVIGAVEHTAVSVAAAVNHIAVTLGSGNAHGRTMELLDQQGLGGLGAKVAQEHHQGIDTVGTDIGNGSGGILLIFNGDGAFIQALAVGSHNILAALGGQGNGEAVTGNGNNAQLDFGNVVHGNWSPFLFSQIESAMSMFSPTRPT